MSYKVGISKIKASDKIIIEFTKEHKMNPDKLIKLVTKHFSEGMSVSPDNQIIFNQEFKDLDSKLTIVNYIISSVSL
jgi:transcription-repair coupling factor (superfamily II helicase)